MLWADTSMQGDAVYLGPPAVVDSAAFGPVGNGVADDTAALQAFLDASPTRMHFLRTPASKYRTTATLTIPDAPGYHLYGESRQHTVIELDASNTAVLQTAGIYQHNYLIEDLQLRFKTPQPAANTNAVGLLFAGPAGAECQNYYSHFARLFINGARTGIDQLSRPGFQQAVWNCVFDDIKFENTSHSLINLESAVAAGMPVNTFRMITSYLSPGTGPALHFVGVEFSIDGLDVEDWAGNIIVALSGSGTVRGVHLERHRFPTASMPLFFFADGAFILDSYTMTFAAASTTGHYLAQVQNARFRLGSGTIDHSAFTGSNNFALLAVVGSPQIDLAMLPIVSGNGAYYGAYFPWEGTAARLLTNNGSATWNPASVATAAQISTTVTVDGAAIGDVVAVGFSVAVPAGVLLTGSVTAANTVTVTMLNQSGGAVDLASGTLRARIWKAL